MKTLIKSFFVLAILGMASSSFAALNMYLNIKGGGKSRIVPLTCSAGACKATVTGMTGGNYTFTLCDAQGTALMKAKEKANRSKSMNFGKIIFTCDVISPRDAGSGLPTGKMATDHEIVSPRDAASGLPTGKRMHKPFVITKELDKSSPTFVATGDVDGDGTFQISVTCKSPDGGIMAMDDWESPSN